MKGLGDAIGSVAMIAGVTGVALYGLVRGFQRFTEWVKQLDATNKKMLEDNRDLAMVNGSMAATFQQLDYDRFRRQVERAEAMSGPLRGLSRSQSAFEGAQQDLFQPYEQLGTFVQSKFTDIATWMLQGLDKLDFVGNLIEIWYNEEVKNKPRSAIESMVEKPNTEQLETAKVPWVDPRRAEKDEFLRMRIRGWRG